LKSFAFKTIALIDVLNEFFLLAHSQVSNISIFWLFAR
jgi:hypothetical protein